MWDYNDAVEIRRETWYLQLCANVVLRVCNKKWKNYRADGAYCQYSHPALLLELPFINRCSASHDSAFRFKPVPLLWYFAAHRKRLPSCVYSQPWCTDMWWQRTGGLFLSWGFLSGCSLAKLSVCVWYTHITLALGWPPLTPIYHCMPACAFQCVTVFHQ